MCYSKALIDSRGQIKTSDPDFVDMITHTKSKDMCSMKCVYFLHDGKLYTARDSDYVQAVDLGLQSAVIESVTNCLSFSDTSAVVVTEKEVLFYDDPVDNEPRLLGFPSPDKEYFCGPGVRGWFDRTGVTAFLDGNNGLKREHITWDSMRDAINSFATIPVFCSGSIQVYSGWLSTTHPNMCHLVLGVEVGLVYVSLKCGSAKVTRFEYGERAKRPLLVFAGYNYPTFIFSCPTASHL